MRRVAALIFAMICAPLGASGFDPPAPGGELRDPTRAPLPIVPGKHAEEHRPRVSALFLSSTRRIAIFDAQPVRAGDTVGAYRIDEVDGQGVRYSVAGRSEFAPLAMTAPPPTAVPPAAAVPPGTGAAPVPSAAPATAAPQ